MSFGAGAASGLAEGHSSHSSDVAFGAAPARAFGALLGAALALAAAVALAEFAKRSTKAWISASLGSESVLGGA